MTRLRLLFLLPLLSLIYFFIFFSLLEAILTIFVFICVVYIFLARFYYDDFVTIINYSLAQLPTTREFDINDHSEKDYNITSPEPWENAYFQKKFKIEKKGNFLLKRPCNNTKIEFVTNMEVFGEYDNFSKKLRKIDMPRYTKTTRVKKIFVGNNKTLEYLIRATTRNIIDSIIISKCTFRSDLNGNSKPNYRLSCRRKFDTFLVHKSIGELLNFEKLVRFTFCKEFEIFPKLSKSSRSVRFVESVNKITPNHEYLINEYFRLLLKYPIIRSSLLLREFLTETKKRKCKCK